MPTVADLGLVCHSLARWQRHIHSTTTSNLTLWGFPTCNALHHICTLSRRHGASSVLFTSRWRKPRLVSTPC